MLIINHFALGTALARYTSELHTAVGDLAEIANVQFSPTKQNFPPGKFFQGTKSQVLNVFFRRFVYHKLHQSVSQMISGSGIVHYTEQSMPFFSNGGEREVVTFHDLFAMNGGNRIEDILFKRYTKKSLKFRNAIAISKYTKQKLEEGKFDGEISVIYHGIPKIFHLRNNKMELRKKYNLPLDKKVIISVSTDAKRKNLALLKQIAAVLPDHFKILRIGPSLGFDLNFATVTDETLAELYSASDLFLLTSTEEGFNFPVVEAMASGLPVVVSNIDIMQEIVGRSGIYCDLKGVDSFLEGIKTSIDQWEKFSKSSIERAKFFSLEKFETEMRNYYSHLL